MAPVALAQPPIQDPITELNAIITSPSPDITRAKAILGSPGYSDRAYILLFGVIKDTFTKVSNGEPVPHDPRIIAENIAAIFRGSSISAQFTEDISKFIVENPKLNAHLAEYLRGKTGDPSPQEFLLYVITQENPKIVPVKIDLSLGVADALTVFGKALEFHDASILQDFKQAYASLSQGEKTEFEKQFKSRFAALYRGYTNPNKGTARAFDAVDCLERVQAIQKTRAKNVADERMHVRFGKQFVSAVPQISPDRALRSVTDVQEAIALGYEYIEGTKKLLDENHIASDPRTVLENIQSRMQSYARAFGPALAPKDAELILGVAKEAKEHLESLAAARTLGDPKGELDFLGQLAIDMGRWKQALDSISKRLQEETIALDKEMGTLASEFTPENMRPSTFDLNSSSLGKVERLLSTGLFGRAVLALDQRALDAEILRYQDHLRTITDPQEFNREASRMSGAVASWKTRARSIVERYITIYGDQDGSLKTALAEALKAASATDVSKLYELLDSLNLSQKYDEAKGAQADAAAATSRYRNARASFTRALERIGNAAKKEMPRAVRDNEDEIQRDLQTIRESLLTIGLDEPALNRMDAESTYEYALRVNAIISQRTFDAAVGVRTREAELLPVIEKYVTIRSEIQQIAGELAFATEQNRSNPTPETQTALEVVTQRFDAAKVRWMADMQGTVAELRARTRSDSAVTVVSSLRDLSSALDADSQIGVYTQLTLKLARSKSDLDALALRYAAYQSGTSKVPLTPKDVKPVIDSIPNPVVLKYFLDEGIKATERIVGYYEGTRRGAPYAVNRQWVDAMLGFLTRAQNTVAAGVFTGEAEPEVGALIFRAYLATHGLGDLKTLEENVRNIGRALDKIDVRLSSLYSIQDNTSLDSFEARLDEILQNQEREFFDRPDTLRDLQEPINDLKDMITQARRSGQDLNALLQSAQTREFIVRQYAEIENIITTDVPPELRERFAVQFYSSWNKQASPSPANDYTELAASIRTILNDSDFLAFDTSLARDQGQGGLVGRNIAVAQTFNLTLTNAGTGPTGISQAAQEVELNQNGEVLTAWRTLTPEMQYAVYQLMNKAYGSDWNTKLNSSAFDQFTVLVLSMQNGTLNQGQAFSPLSSSYGALFLSQLGPGILRFNDPGMTQFLTRFFTDQAFIAINTGNHPSLEKYFKVAAEKLRDIYPRIFDVAGNYQEDPGQDDRVRLPSENIAQLFPSNALRGAINLPPVVYKVVHAAVEGVQKSETDYIQSQPGQVPNPQVTKADYDSRMVSVQINVPNTGVTILRILPDLSELVLNIHPESGEFLSFGGAAAYQGITAENTSFADVVRRNSVTGELNPTIEGRNARISDQRDWNVQLTTKGEGKAAQLGVERGTTEQETEGEQFEGVGSSTKATTDRVKVSGFIQNEQFADSEGERGAFYGSLLVDRADSTQRTSRVEAEGEQAETTDDDRKIRDLIEASLNVIDMKDPRYRYAYFLRTEWDPGLAHPFDSEEEPGGYITRIYMYGKTQNGYVLINERTIPYDEARNLYKTFTPMTNALERMHGEVKESVGPVDFKSSITGFFVGEALIDGTVKDVQTRPLLQGVSATGQVGPFGMLVMHETTRAGRTAVGGGIFGRERFGSVAGFRYGQRDVAEPSEDIPLPGRQSFIKESQKEAQQVKEGYQAEFLFTTSEQIAVRAFAGLEKLSKDKKGDPEAIFGALWQAKLGGYATRFSVLSNQGTVTNDGVVSGEGTRAVGGSIVAPSLVDAAVAYAIAKKAMDEEWGGVGTDKIDRAAAALQYYFSKDPELNNRLIAAGVWNEESWRTLVTNLTHYFESPVIGFDEVTGGYAFLTRKGEPIYHLAQLYLGPAPESSGLGIEFIGLAGGGMGGALKLDAQFADHSITLGGVAMPFATGLFGGAQFTFSPSVHVSLYGTSAEEQLTQEGVFGSDPTVTSHQALLSVSINLEGIHASLGNMTAIPFVSGITQTDDPAGTNRSEANQLDAGVALSALSALHRFQFTLAAQTWGAEQETGLDTTELTRSSIVGRASAEFLGAFGLSRLTGAFTGTFFGQSERGSLKRADTEDGDTTIETTDRSRSDRTGFTLFLTLTGEN